MTKTQNMPRSVCFLTVIGIALCSFASGQACTPLFGIDQVWSNVNIHWLLVGELHGSNETPEIFFDVICNARKKGKRVVVALERATSEQDSLTDMLVAGNLAEARSKLLNQPGWTSGMDGRASKAMLQLLLSLRDLNRGYSGISIAAFEAPYFDGVPGARDKSLGDALLQIGKNNPESLILVLIGNAHATSVPLFGYKTAAMYLPADQRLALEVTDRNGESWATIGGACGAHKGGVGDKGIAKPRGIFLDPNLAPFGKVGGIVSLGVPLTASVPAAEIPSPPPPCRVNFLMMPEK
jgi:hypothetical protein